MPADPLFDAFPVLSEVAYFNAGSAGPLPTAASDAIAQEAATGAAAGRGLPYYDRLQALQGKARAAWAGLLHTSPDEIALTAGASDGVVRALSLIDWQAGDHVVTSDEEHPGVTGPLGALIRRTGVRVVQAPWHEVAAAVTPETKLIVVSHVSWLRGRVADLAAIGATGVPIVVDAAQAAGAIPVDLSALRRHGVVAYAAAGQKWTCGPIGTGALWIDLDWAPDHGIGVWPTYGNLEDPASGLAARPWPDARRLDAPSMSCELLAGAVASLDVLEQAGWESVQLRATTRASALANTLSDRGFDVADRGTSTLVSWRYANPERAQAAVLAAAQQRVAVRGFPNEPWVRASVGGWTTDAHIDRLLATITPTQAG